MSEKTALIGVDWGLSQLRAYRIGEHGRLLEVRRSDAGIASISNRAFDEALCSAISDWPSTGRPILLSGMIGSRQGWREAPYAPCPLSLDKLCQVRVESALGEVRIVGGARTRNAHGQYDVMRGEETQMLGLPEMDGRRIVITPGTHSKWSCLERGMILDFRTYMTGELYDLLKNHSTLGWGLAQSGNSEIDDARFQSGVRDALANPDMPHGLFHVRTLSLFGSEPAGNIASYLSGLLIGYEIHGGGTLHGSEPIVIIGTRRLARLYKTALATAGFGDVELVDADVVTATGLWRISQTEGHVA